MIPTFRGGNREFACSSIPFYLLKDWSELSEARQELSGLEALEYQMSRSLELLKQRQSEARFSKTVYGQAFNAAGKVFAVYCVYRIIIVCSAFFFSNCQN